MRLIHNFTCVFVRKWTKAVWTMTKRRCFLEATAFEIWLGKFQWLRRVQFVVILFAFSFWRCRRFYFIIFFRIIVLFTIVFVKVFSLLFYDSFYPILLWMHFSWSHLSVIIFCNSIYMIICFDDLFFFGAST